MSDSAIQDILNNHLKFSPNNGLIELSNSRMLMFNHAAFSLLRKATIEQVGQSVAQMIFARFGYESAINDYRAIDQIFPGLTGQQKLDIGPIMHGWCGLVKVVPEVFQSDRTKEMFLFRGRWLNSYEAQSHIELFGLSKHPVCYSLTGYGSAWCSQFFGMDLLEIETKCIACGDPYCEWEIRPWNEWGPEADAWKQSLTTTDRSIIADLRRHKNEITKLKRDVNTVVQQQLGEHQIKLRALCHDLNTPLQLAIANLQRRTTANDGKTTKQLAWSLHQAKKMVERFHQAEHESQTVNNMKRRTSKLSDIIHSSVSMVQEQLASKQISIDLELCANAFSFTDPDIARDHVIVNILTNAIKFSHMGSRVSISAESINPGQSLIKITDHGIGIPKKILERLRRQKSLSARTGTRGEHGNGHGLSVANFFAQKLGGRLSIQSVSSSIDPTNSGTTTEIVL